MLKGLASELRASPGRGWGSIPRPGGRSGDARRCRRAATFAIGFLLSAFPSNASANANLSIVVSLCTDPKAEAVSIAAELEETGWSLVPSDRFEIAARHLGDGAILSSRFGETPSALKALREEAFRRQLARVKRKSSSYFVSSTLRSPDNATVVNVFWSKQGNRLQCIASTSDRKGIEELGSQVASLTETGRINDVGPSWNVRAATGGDNPLRVWLSVLKQDTTALFVSEPLSATVGLFAEYFPRRD